MNPEKIGQFIKEIRKKNNLTQKDLADKYNVTYQAVSKWENGKNLPDILLIKQMSKDFNIDINNILDGEYKINKHKLKLIILIIIIMIILSTSIILISNIKQNSEFNFKTISSMCSDFKVTGSLAYDKNKSSIYISNIDYCGGDDKTIYDSIECTLYEKENNTLITINNCEQHSNISLEEYLKLIQININNYEQMCKTYDNNLYLEINAIKDNNTTKYEIPLNIKDNCN